MKKSETGKAAPVSTGTFLFARPGKFIWTYVKPYEQLLQADGEQLYIYDKDLNQVTVKKLGNALGSSPAAILFGSNDLEKNFTLSEAGSPRRPGMAGCEAEGQGQRPSSRSASACATARRKRWSCTTRSADLGDLVQEVREESGADARSSSSS